MTATPPHLGWLVDTGQRVKTKDDTEAEIWELRHLPDPAILSAWACHFRQQYCLDADIDSLRSGTGHSRADYLKNLVFPDLAKAPGPSIRAGDFAEILVSDLLEFVSQYWVPRTRYSHKASRNESTKGSDVVALKFAKASKTSKKDELALYEVKAQFSGSPPCVRLQDAVDDSVKDDIRKAESLNAIKRRLRSNGNHTEAMRVERFQDPLARPYTEISGAVAVIEENLFDANQIKKTTCKGHPNKKRLRLIVVRGSKLMTLVHSLYKSAADEA